VFLLSPHFVEIIHVELTHKRSEIFVPEVDGKDVLLKLLDVFDVEAQPIVTPRNELGMFLFLNRNIGYLQYFVGFRDEGGYA
jgi:hypothetical protein